MLAAAGDLYVADTASNTVLKFSPDGSRTTFASGFGSIADLAFDRYGNLFVADAGSPSAPPGDVGSGTISKFSPDGSKSTFATELRGLLRMAFDATGNLFVTNSVC